MTTGNDDMWGSNASNAYSFDSFKKKKKGTGGMKFCIIIYTKVNYTYLNGKI